MIPRRRVGIIGTGRIAKECAKMLTQSNQIEWVASVVDSSRETLSPDFEQFLKVGEHNHVVSSAINELPVINFLRGLDLDLAFSINNHQMIKSQLRESIQGGIINFHNGPLPRYAGLNACSWAIYNGETEHGATWHWVDEGVDSGEIVAQRMFEIPRDSTARKLIMMSISEGIELFGEVVAQCEQGTLARVPQDMNNRLFYSSRAVPGGAKADFSQTIAQIDRLVRALNFTPMRSPLPQVSASIMGRAFFIDEVRAGKGKESGGPGMVIRADEVLEVQVSDGALEMSKVRNQDGKRILVPSLIRDYSIAPGMYLDEETNV